ncbi:MAG: type II toxin-antitoxin system HicB family antitoxin [Candidatus Parabeggiatoa sp. nov. 2]|nr:MAG: type II toxin-antitoxin system HicB family antitoxin [Gammaproteobacteria bacterium]
MMKISIVYKEENKWYIGHLQEYPDYESQGETLDELKKNLLDIYHDIKQGLVSEVKPFKVLELNI